MKILLPRIKGSPMKHAIPLLGLTLLMSTASATQEVQLRYGKPSGVVNISIDQDIRAGEYGAMVAGRTFSTNLALRADPEGEEISVTINKIKATYTAHEMKQRLATSHLAGQGFKLSIIDDGRALERSEPGPVVELGWYLKGGFPVGWSLIDLLPALPESPVSAGSTWATERKVQSLEGWTWAAGQLKSRHVVTAVEERNGHLIVSIETEAEALLGAVEGSLVYAGEGKFERTLSWRFDATAGWPVSVSMKQESRGVNEMPRGSTQVGQITSVELSIAD
jgi:hypothetical protein